MYAPIPTTAKKQLVHQYRESGDASEENYECTGLGSKSWVFLQWYIEMSDTDEIIKTWLLSPFLTVNTIIADCLG